MLRAIKRIIISSESVNLYGFRVLTDGIDIDQYDKNPIMLWMHNRAFGTKDNVFLPIGNVIELKREELDGVGKVITGQPMFDDTDEFAKSIYNKFENGTLRMASAGLNPKTWSDDESLLMPGQTGYTLVKSVLQEVSIVDIGGNDDALSIALYDDNKELITLSSNGENAQIPQLKQISNDSMKTIQLNAPDVLTKLGLADTAGATEVLAKIDNLVNLSAQKDTEIQTLKTAKEQADAKVTELQNKQTENEVIALVDKAVTDRKIVAGQRDHFIKLAKADKETVEAMFTGMQAAPTVQSQLAADNGGKKDELAELVKLSYDELFENGGLSKLKTLSPDEYEVKMKEKFPSRK
ncbi:phage protease [Solitalea koreensis]|uniref:Mu-like prophage I protein n=1 Tax=Solitalea koreensis TaxID=543615 RepID=A0A521BLR8_9SPHI|nr:phage protease [Solitalea koreensis]SMO48097.1 Mu-like prophage I protein [Solitalea koreensis]